MMRALLLEGIDVDEMTVKREMQICEKLFNCAYV